MRRIPLMMAATLLALPASASAASGHGTVLSVSRAHRTVEVVDAGHVVHAYRYRGRLPRLHAGSRIAFRRSGVSISGVRVASNRSSSVSFYGRVVKSGRKGLTLLLADRHKVTFSSRQVRHRRSKMSGRRAGIALVHAGLGGVTINIQGLQPGVVVLITETVEQQGSVTITISFPPPSDPVAGGEQQASGTVTDAGADAFVLTTDDGSDLRLHMSMAALASLNLQVCDTLDVSYHQDAGMLIADHVTATGTSSSGDCADSQDEQDATGTITQVGGDSVTISTQDQGTLTFAVDSADLIDGFQTGDLVDVTYVQDGSGLSAVDIEYVEQDVTGQVTAVSDGSLTVSSADVPGGQPVTFTADPSLAMFDGVAVGDQVDVNYHLSNGQPVVDGVDDASGD